MNYNLQVRTHIIIKMAKTMIFVINQQIINAVYMLAQKSGNIANLALNSDRKPYIFVVTQRIRFYLSSVACTKVG